MDVGPSKALVKTLSHTEYVWGVTLALCAFGAERCLFFFYYMIHNFFPAVPKHVKNDIETRALKKRQRQLQSSMGDSFHVMDANGDGRLDSAEVYAALRARGHHRQGKGKEIGSDRLDVAETSGVA